MELAFVTQEVKKHTPVVQSVKLLLQCFSAFQHYTRVRVGNNFNAHPNRNLELWAWKTSPCFKVSLLPLKISTAAKRTEDESLSPLALWHTAGLNLFQNKSIYRCTKTIWNLEVGFKSQNCGQMKKQPYASSLVSPLATSVGSSPVKSVCWCTYQCLQIATIHIFYKTYQNLSNPIEVVLNNVIITISNAEDSQLLSTPGCQAAGGVNLKQFTMKYQAFNNHVCVNTVFICKRVYFFDSHQREVVRLFTLIGQLLTVGGMPA